MSTSIFSIRTNCPAIRIKLGEAMSINKKVLHALNDPQNILFWWCKSEKILLIGSILEKTSLSFNINNCYYGTKAGFTIENSKLIQTILRIADWRSDMVYTVMGEYIAELDMVAFKLNDAVELEVETD